MSSSRGDRWSPAAYSSGRTEPAKDLWETPESVFTAAEVALGVKFDLDAAASRGNSLCGSNYNGLDNDRGDLATVDWLTRPDGRRATAVWCNPPYSMANDFLARAVAVVSTAPPPYLIAVLVFARTDTRWWWRHVLGRDRNGVKVDRGADRVLWRQGRIRFEAPPALGRIAESDSAPAPSALIVYEAGIAINQWPINGVL